MEPRLPMHRFWRVLAPALAVAIAPGCPRSRPIRVGVALDPTAQAGAVLAEEDLNAAGGVQGRRVQLVFDTARYDPSTQATVRRAEFLADAGLAVVLSDNVSQQSLVLGSVFNERGVVHLNPNSTSPRIHDLGPWSFALCPDDRRNGRFLAERIRADVPDARVAILYLNSAYGEGLRRGMDSALSALGVRVVWELPFVDVGAIPDLLSLVERDGATVVALASYWEGLAATAHALEAHRAAGRPRVYGGDAAVPVRPSPGTDGVRIVAFWSPDLPDSASRRFARRFQERFGAPARPVDAMNYDGVRLAAAAVARSDGSSAGARRYLEMLGTSRPAFDGLSGPISFRDRRRAGARLLMAEYRGGQLSLIQGDGAQGLADR
jgi:branched-chain amino acid transport system substrate-binding protein